VSGTAADNVAVSKVEVSIDGGVWNTATGTTSWTFSLNTQNQLNGSHTISARATDSTGAVQPERDKFIAEHGHNAVFHYNAIQAWSVEANGEVKHVYA